jgi:hypothetical protein
MTKIMKVLTFTKRMLRDEKGQALPLVLIFLVVGGLTITPSLSHATSSLIACRNSEENINGFFAADAGVQYAVWCLESMSTPPAQLSECINDMDVTMNVEDMGGFTLYFGELIQTGQHSNYLDVIGDIVWDEPAQAYKYTITITWQPGSGTPTIHLEGIGARMPLDYVYQMGSAAGFVDNLSLADPTQSTDSEGALMVNWEFHGTLPYVTETDPVATQAFYVTGPEDQEGHYAWAAANRNDIGGVGEITGNLYTVTATATRTDTAAVTAQIVAGVLQDAVSTSIVSWRINR